MNFGQAGDIPVPGNYDGLGYDQVAVYRPSTGNIYVLQPGGTTEVLNLGVGSSPDLASLVPVPAAYDNIAYFNAGKAERTEAAVFDPKTGVFTILGPNGTTYTVSSGFQAGDIPAPADYLGDGEAQPVVFRPSTGQFITAGGTIIATFGAGASTDIPLAAPLSYRMPANPPTTGTGGGSTGSGGGSGTGTGTGTTGTGTGTGTTGTGTGTGTTGTGSGNSSGQGSTTTTTTTTTSPSSTATAPKSVTGSKKKKTKTVVVHKKVTKPAKPKKVEKKAPKAPAKKVVKVVKHTAKKTVKVSTAHALASKPKSVVDLALESVHVNLRRSSGKKA